MAKPPAVRRRDPGAFPAAAGFSLPAPPAHGRSRIVFPGARRVYAVVCSRARGLVIGIDLTPNRCCNFSCCYCESAPVNRDRACSPEPVDARALAAELEAVLHAVSEGQFAALPRPSPLMQVAISGDGEPTLCPNFLEAIEAVVHLRASGRVPFFRLLLLTNASQLNAPEVSAGLRLFNRADEIWAKLDAGTQAGLERINQSSVPLDRILDNILALGRRRPVVIQSMFVDLEDAPPPSSEFLEYVHRLADLKSAGAAISLVQVYSATRPPTGVRCCHLPLRELGRMAAMVRALTGLNVEVF